jgi:hypothetical protein
MLSKVSRFGLFREGLADGGEGERSFGGLGSSTCVTCVRVCVGEEIARGPMLENTFGRGRRVELRDKPRFMITFISYAAGRFIPDSYLFDVCPSQSKKL